MRKKRVQDALLFLAWPIVNRTPLTENEITGLLSIIKREAKATRRMRQVWPLLNRLQFVFLAAYFFGVFRCPEYQLLFEKIFYPIFAGYVGIALWCLWRMLYARRTLASLARGDDLRLLGPLYDVLFYADSTQDNTIIKSLLTLLPRVAAGDCPPLTEDQRMGLHSTLYSENAPLVLATLGVLEHLADSRCLQCVEALSEGKFNAAARPEIAALASELLPRLRKRFAERERADELLRPVEADVSSTSLLRPMENRRNPNPHELLHPLEQENDNDTVRKAEKAC